MKSFETFSPDSKLWIYQASREFTVEEHTVLRGMLSHFCKDWTAHNNQLKADFDLVYDRFITLVVDESHNTASGCSIDKSVHLLKDIGGKFEIDFFDKMHIAYMLDYEFQISHYNDLKNLYKKGKIDDDTLFFDTNIQTLSDYENFVKPLKNHWLIAKVK
ncbi:MAG: ABC transporter ATPase [bacterium]|nr:ABC transporter ATPase [bacterium]